MDKVRIKIDGIYYCMDKELFNSLKAQYANNKPAFKKALFDSGCLYELEME